MGHDIGVAGVRVAPLQELACSVGTVSCCRGISPAEFGAKLLRYVCAVLVGIAREALRHEGRQRAHERAEGDC
jgi:hypothetical protein